MALWKGFTRSNAQDQGGHFCIGVDMWHPYYLVHFICLFYCFRVFDLQLVVGEYCLFTPP